ncbi:MAG: hypothetical protein CSA36_03635 [Draconibacterium sp.]|nr:MAG: hypothetical protein CSA36_03635 [Draconibacterium sp.]
MRKAIFSKITIILLIIICAWYGKNLNAWGKNKVIQSDVNIYYAYLPATFIFHDLNFDFTKELPEDFEGQIWLQTSPKGKPILRMTMGLAILWIPFFLTAHVAAHILGVSTLGYSWPYSFSIFVATLFYLFLGLLFLRKILLRYFSDIVVALTLTLLVIATNLMHYVISEPGMSHVYNFALIAAFLYFSLKWIENTNLKYSVLLGIMAGLIVLIRPVNILVLLFPAFIGVQSFIELKKRIIDNWKIILIAGLSAFIVFFPQMLYWKALSGQFLFNSYMNQGKFYFMHPYIVDGLFSFRKGWLVYTPVMLFSLIGIVWLRKYAPKFFLPVLLFTVLNIYVVFSWWCWWYGGSFGSRPMIDMYGIMALPMAAFLNMALRGRNWFKIPLIALLLFFIWLNQFQMKQYRLSLLHWDSMTKEAYFGIFGKKTWPQDYDKMIKVPDYEKALKGEEE